WWTAVQAMTPRLESLGYVRLASGGLDAGRLRRGRYCRHELPHALDSGADVLDAVGVGEAQVALSPGPERCARNGGDARILQKPVLHLLRGHARALDVGEGVEGAGRQAAAHAGDAVQAFVDNG